MKNRTVIPYAPAPDPISPVVQKRYDAWIKYFKKLSPRIMVILPGEEKFDMKNFEDQAKKLAHQDDDIANVELNDWPDLSGVAFMVCYDSSMPGQIKKIHSPDNAYIFCFGGFAFGLGYFEYDEDMSTSISCYGLGNYPVEALRWKYIAKLIRDSLVDIEKQVPLPPK